MIQKPSYYIRRLNSTTKMNEKKAILREAALDGCIHLFEGFKLAYDRTVSFKIKKVPIIKGNFTRNELTEDIGEFGWKDFIKLINKLSNNKLTKKATHSLLHSIANIVCIEDWNLFYRAILTKNMKCGITEITINKVLNDIGGDALQYVIPIWKIHLGSDSSDYSEKIIGEKAIDANYNGIRVLTIMNVEAQTVTMIRSNGKEIKKYQTIIDGLVKFLPALPASIIFDGEIVENNLQYAIFDMLLLVDFKNGGTSMNLMDRHAGLIELAPYLQETSNGIINIVPKKIINLDSNNGFNEMKNFYDEAINTGHKYIVIKDINSPYVCNQNTFWLNWKP